MNTVLSLLRDFIAAQQAQQETKTVFLAKQIEDDDYFEARDAFRNADDVYTELFARVLVALEQAQLDDTTDELMDALGAQDATKLFELLSSQGVQGFLDPNATRELSMLIRKYRQANAVYTAARELNARRRLVDPAEFEELLDTPAAGCDADAWAKVVKLLSVVEEEVEAEPGSEDLEAEDITREAVYRIEEKKRKRADTLTEKLIDVFRDLMDRGQFDLAISELDIDERRAAYQLQNLVPQPKRQTQTKS